MRQTILEVVLALGIAWLGCAALSGCVVTQTQAYQTIYGGN